MSEDIESSLKWWHFLFVILIVLCLSTLLFLVLVNCKHILIDKLAFAQTTPMSLLLLFAMPILMFVTWMVSIVYFKRHMKHKENPKIQRTFNVLIILCGIGLFTPILIGPLTSHYMKSKGYEKCKPENTTTFTSTLNQYWAKPEIGCGVWDLNHKERQVIKEEILNTQSN